MIRCHLCWTESENSVPSIGPCSGCGMNVCAKCAIVVDGEIICDECNTVSNEDPNYDLDIR